ASSTVPYTKQQAARAADHNWLGIMFSSKKMEEFLSEEDNKTATKGDKDQGVCYNKEVQ
ncbi:12352_t:CDS:2, partial [Entrophospora sp. SA101]